MSYRVMCTTTAVLLVLAGVTYGAPIISFDALETAGFGFTEDFDFYSEAGFDLTAGGFNTTQPGEFAYYHQSSGFYPGSAGLLNNVSGGLTTLTKSDNGLFDLLQIDLSEGLGDQDTPAVIEFTGTKGDTSTVTTSFTLDGTFGFETFSFTGAGFTDLAMVEWRNFFPFHQFDNIEVAPASTAVPEPGSLALLSICGTLFVASRRRSRRMNGAIPSSSSSNA